MLVLLFVALWFILWAVCFTSYLVLFYSCVLSPFGDAIALLGKERAGLGAFRTFFDLCLFGFIGFLFLLVSGNGCGL